MFRKLNATVLAASFVLVTMISMPFGVLAQKASPVAPDRARAEAVIREAY